MCQSQHASADAHIVTAQYADVLESDNLTAVIAEVPSKFSPYAQHVPPQWHAVCSDVAPHGHVACGCMDRLLVRRVSASSASLACRGWSSCGGACCRLHSSLRCVPTSHSTCRGSHTLV
jgi:hypothetical protein